MKIKKLWKGIFNFQLGIVREYAYAYTKKQARVIMARRIAKKQGIDNITLFRWLEDHPTRYSIQIEREG